MKHYLWLLVSLWLTTPLLAQTNSPHIKLAIVAESPEATAVADVLTAELSKNDRLQLLERAEIERVYREQGLSAGNKNYLKLGQILGADGLLLLESVTEGTNQFLNTGLIAVKPGVVLVAEKYPSPNKDLAGWTPIYVKHLNGPLTKLTVLTKDAIPISVVNLRSAVSSQEALETERQLKLLAIQRLSQERQLFVLERQRMKLLGEEKELKGDDSAFWNGSYLLEGVVDQNGYSKETVTINAKLTPPKGGTPVLIEASGSRTNLAEIINQLAAKIIATLKVKPTVKEWSTADEAQQFFEEANWALRWGIFKEAQAAADSAWALGKRDLNCATVRVQAYMAQINMGGFTEIPCTNPNNLQNVTNAACSIALPNRPLGLILSEQVWRPNTTIVFAFANRYPDNTNIDRAIRALESYDEFSRAMPQNELKPDSGWYRLGIANLTTASRVLQHFHFIPSSQKTAPEKLSHLRSLTRRVAEWISSCPAIRDTYSQNLITGEPPPTLTDDIFHPFPENIFSCEVIWGCFWQERPEDCTVLYRKLMTGPAFWKIHDRLWFRDILTLPCVTGWSDEDRKRIPIVWNNFMQELKNSTNRFLQIEGVAPTLNVEMLEAMDGNGWLTIEPTKNDRDFYQELQYLKNQEHRNDPSLLIKSFNPDEFLATFQFRDYSKWQAQKIKPLLNRFATAIDIMTGFASGDDKVKLQKGIPLVASLQDDVVRILNAPDPKLLAEEAQKNLAAFEKQKQYLETNTPYDVRQFSQLFKSCNYTKDQATELHPLLMAYQSNLIAQAEGKPIIDQLKAKNYHQLIELFISQKIIPSLNPLPPPKTTVATVQNPNPAPARPEPPKIVSPAAEKPAETVTNILMVNNYLKIPVDKLEAPYIRAMEISSSRWSGGKFLSNLRYQGSFEKGNTAKPFLPGTDLNDINYLAAVAIFDPANGKWQVVEFPREVEFPGKDDSRAEHSMNYAMNSSVEIFQNKLFLSFTDKIYRYDLSAQRWQALAYPGQKEADLFTVNGHLYAVNDESIMEILDLGTNTHLLASTRRHPEASALDAFEHLGKVTLFGSSIHPLGAKVGNSIFIWAETNWTEQWIPSIPDYMHPAYIKSKLEPSEEGQLIRIYQEQDQNDLWVWRKDQPLPELWLRDMPTQRPLAKSNNGVNRSNRPGLQPLHRSLPGNPLASATATLFKSDLYLLLDHSSATNLSGRWVPKEQDGYNAKLVCFCHGFQEPFIIPMKLTVEQSQPVTRINHAKPVDQPRLITDYTWMRFESGNLYIGQPETLGIWVIPIAEVEAAIALQKQSLIAKKNKKDEDARQLLGKHDRNHNGIIDPDEREKILDDPTFIESELDAIDANHDGLLDAEELIYFDPSNNKALNPKGQAGIEIAQQLLAERLLIRFDSNGDGWLDRQEFSSLLESTFEPSVRSAPDVSSFSGAKGNHIGPKEMEAFVVQLTLRGIRPQTAIPASFRQARLDTNQPADPRQIFKMFTEYYWQSRSGSNRPPVNN